jgi:hypothetical protein
MNERGVRRGTDIVGVNGWELRPSRATYDYLPGWDIVDANGAKTNNGDVFTSRHTQRVAYKHQFEDEDGMKGIIATFGKAVVKPAFLHLSV